MFRIAIVEDDLRTAEELKNYVLRFEKNEGVECSVDMFSNGLEFVSSNPPPLYDLVLMDIKMPHMNGINVAKRLRKFDKDVALIFITSMARYAIEGYSVDALDFMIKPVDYFNFSLKLKKALNHSLRHLDKTLFVEVDDAIHRLRVRDILYVEVMGHTITYHMVGGGCYTTSGMLTRLEEELSGYNFCRCNKCYLVNLNNIEQVQGNTVVVGGDRLLVSRRRKKILMDALARHLGGVFGLSVKSDAEQAGNGDRAVAAAADKPLTDSLAQAGNGDRAVAADDDKPLTDSLAKTDSDAQAGEKGNGAARVGARSKKALVNRVIKGDGE